MKVFRMMPIGGAANSLIVLIKKRLPSADTAY